jgi:hypothetical protein
MSADDVAATRLVLDILSDPAIAGIDFDLDAISVSPAMYREVSQAIIDKKITVLVLPEALKPNESGVYFPELKLPNGMVFFDVLALRFPDRGSSVDEQTSRALAIVHESTHAGFAMRKLPHMTHTLHEAGAYTAQSMFVLTKMLNRGGHPERVNNTEPIQSAAWKFALLLNRSNAAVPGTPAAEYFKSVDFAAAYASATSALYTAIAGSSEYGAVAKDPIENVGLGRPWITAPRTPAPRTPAPRTRRTH